MTKTKQSAIQLNVVVSMDSKAQEILSTYRRLCKERMNVNATWGTIPGNEVPVLAGIGIPGFHFKVKGIAHKGAVLVLSRIPGLYSIMFFNESHALVKFPVNIPEKDLIPTLDREITGGASMGIRMHFLEKTQPELVKAIMEGTLNNA